MPSLYAAGDELGEVAVYDVAVGISESTCGYRGALPAFWSVDVPRPKAGSWWLIAFTALVLVGSGAAIAVCSWKFAKTTTTGSRL